MLVFVMNCFLYFCYYIVCFRLFIHHSNTSVKHIITVFLVTLEPGNKMAPTLGPWRSSWNSSDKISRDQPTKTIGNKEIDIWISRQLTSSPNIAYAEMDNCAWPKPEVTEGNVNNNHVLSAGTLITVLCCVIKLYWCRFNIRYSSTRP